MNRGYVLALGLVLVIAESAAADIGPIPGPSVPQLPDPPSLPQVPNVPLPVPDVPDVPVVSDVVEQLPVPVPSVPSPSVPSVSRPQAPQSSSGGGGGGGGASAPSVSRAARSGGGGGSAPSVAGSGGRAAASPRPVSPRAVPDRAAQAPDRVSPRVQRRERRLRRTISRKRSCLDGLPMIERRVLVLRSGLGPGGPRTRMRVAQRLDLSARRVVRIERRGLRRLRGFGRGGCGVSVPAAAPMVSSIAAAVFDWFSPLAAPLTGTRDEVRVKGERESSLLRLERGPDPKLAPRAVAEPPASIVTPRAEEGTDLTVPVLALLALIALAVVLRYDLLGKRRT